MSKSQLPRVLVLAAGLGTRLRPYTNTQPKALVEVAHKPMLSYSLDLFEKYGFKEILINTHHFSDQLKNFIYEENKKRALKIEIQDESNLLLGSGGAVAQAKSWLFDQGKSSALFWNPDGLLNIDLLEFYTFHAAAANRGILATMCVLAHPEVGKRYHPVFFDSQNKEIIGFGREHNKEQHGNSHQSLHFAGGYFLEKPAADLLPNPGSPCDIAKEVWFPLVKQHKFSGFLYTGAYQDLGEAQDIPIASQRVLNGDFPWIKK